MDPERFESPMELVEEGAPTPTETPADDKSKVAAPEETPAPEAKPEETPKEETPAEVPVVEATLYDLPDGRKVDAETLQKEWKENFLPEFTRKSQELAALKGGDGKGDITKVPDGEAKDKWKDPNYVPESYAEIVELATQEALRKIEQQKEAEVKRIQEIQTAVEGQITEVKKMDPAVDENALFLHANKYGFTDLKAAFLNMKDMKNIVVETEQRTAKNIKAREADPVSDAASGSVVTDEGYDPNEASQYSNAVEYLARVKGK